MSLRLPKKEMEKLYAHVREGYPHEVVGILAGERETGGVRHVEPLFNERSETNNRYQVGPLILQRREQALEAQGLEILGYYHSHPDHPAQYSDFDRDHALPNMSYLIIAVHQGEVVDIRSWRLREDRSAMEPEPIVGLQAAGIFKEQP